MSSIEIVLVLFLGGILAVLIYVHFLRKETPVEDSNSMLLLQQQLEQLRASMDQQRETIDERLGESGKQMYDSLKEQSSRSQQLIQDINKQVGEQLQNVVRGVTTLGETNKQVVGFAEQLKQLQDVLKNPKQRGILGEYYLETVLQNVLPPGSYQMQYGFPNGEIVDAAVFVKDKIIPVDSKFSLENYNRLVEAPAAERPALEKAFVNDLKLRITETSKYIRPTDGTTDFAFMFIPSEGVYYDLLSNKVGGGEENLIQRSAGKHKVIIVSPTSFLAYLQTVLQGLKAMQIEETAKDIIKNVEKLGIHIGKYEEFHKKLGNTLATTVNHYNAASKELGKVDKDVTRITGEAIGVDILELDKPTKDEV